MRNYVKLKFLLIKDHTIIGKGNTKGLERDLSGRKILYCNHFEESSNGYSFSFMEYPGLILNVGHSNWIMERMCSLFPGDKIKVGTQSVEIISHYKNDVYNVKINNHKVKKIIPMKNLGNFEISNPRYRRPRR